MSIDIVSIDSERLLAYLKQHRLTLVTAESCTAGLLISTLADIEGCGECVDCGFVVYSRESKQDLLNVQSSTIDEFNLTSEEVAREMAAGAFQRSDANVAIATTGVAGPTSMDGIPPGMVCVAWGFLSSKGPRFYSRTVHLQGDRQQIRRQASNFALTNIERFHQSMLVGHFD